MTERSWNVSRVARLLCHGLWATALAGCASPPGDIVAVANDQGIELGSPEHAGAWLFWPASIRIHPLTTVARPTDGSPASIDLRVEAMDSLGEPTRAVGTFVVTIRAGGAKPSESRWKIAVDSLDAHRKRFDPVTETYRFAIAPTWDVVPDGGTELTVEVTLYSADGNAPKASSTVMW